MRLQLEAQNYPGATTFLTLTYADDTLPLTDDGVPTCRIQDGSDFVKRLRKNTGLKLRYYICSEYGDHNARPHLHAFIYGLPFPYYCPKEIYRPALAEQKRLDKLGIRWRFYSPLELEILKAWQCRGSIKVGEYNRQRADYQTKYISKGIIDTRELHPGQEKQQARMSRRPGLGYAAVPSLARTLENHELTLRELKGEGLTEIPFNVFNTAAGASSDMSSRKKRGYPVPRYLRDKLVNHLGGDVRTDEEKRADNNRPPDDEKTFIQRARRKQALLNLTRRDLARKGEL